MKSLLRDDTVSISTTQKNNPKQNYVLSRIGLIFFLFLCSVYN